MPSSIAHPDRPLRGKPAAEVERDDLRALLAAILETLAVPEASSIRRQALVDLRAARVVETLRAVLGEAPCAGIPWETTFLRTMLTADKARCQAERAERAPVPYALTDEAQAVGRA